VPSVTSVRYFLRLPFSPDIIPIAETVRLDRIQERMSRARNASDAGESRTEATVVTEDVLAINQSFDAGLKLWVHSFGRFDSLPKSNSTSYCRDLRTARFHLGGKWYHYDTMHFEYRPELLP
jgi:hypothetical protein